MKSSYLYLTAMILLVLLGAVLLSGCGGKAPEPQIITKEVKVAVPTPCNPTLQPRPPLMDKDQIKTALATAPTFDDKVKIISEQLLLYVGWVPIVEAGLKGCAGSP